MTINRTPKSSRWYPEEIAAGDFNGDFDRKTIDFIQSEGNTLHRENKSTLAIAEIGVWKGATSLQFAKFLDGQGTLHLFDYEDTVLEARRRLEKEGYSNIKTWGSSYKYLDSYNWSLMKILANSPTPIFDYVYIDGAHTWAIDALTYFLCDLLLKPGGYIDFDDHDWRLRDSSMDPTRVPETGELYTDEQIDTYQVQLILDQLVRRNPSYKELSKNKIFQKYLSGSSDS